MKEEKENIVKAKLFKGRQARARKLSHKQKTFVKEYTKTLNGTQSALKAYDTSDPNVAGAIASENLTKPKIKEEINRLLAGNGISIEEILTFHKRNMVQDINYPTSQKAIGDFYELLGLKTTDKPTNEVKIAFVIEK